MTTWTAAQAEAWMRAHPGRWVERDDGVLVCWQPLMVPEDPAEGV